MAASNFGHVWDFNSTIVNIKIFAKEIQFWVFPPNKNLDIQSFIQRYRIWSDYSALPDLEQGFLWMRYIVSTLLDPRRY
jgi:hypothetical protein